VGQKVSAGKHFSQKYYGGQKSPKAKPIQIMFKP
jgi:hypothetical protein